MPSPKLQPALVAFSSILLLIFIADSAISYLSPVVMTQSFGNPALMGLVLSWSSVVGVISDLFLPKFFGHQPYTFHVRVLLISMFTFPVCFLLLPHAPWMFVLSMSIWGIYFEFLRFAQFTFIHTILPVADHSRGWGVFETTRSVGYVIGPIMSGWLLDQNQEKVTHLPFLGIMGILVLAAVLYRLYEFSLKRWLGLDHTQAGQVQHRSFWAELAVWRVLFKKIWLVYLFLFSLVLIDTAFWSVGALLMEQLRESHWVGGLLLAAYSAPAILFSSRGAGLVQAWGKKRVAFGMTLLGALVLAVGAVFVQGSAFVGVVFVGAAFLAVGYPKILATFEDYMVRLGPIGSDLVGLEATATNFAYILGPVAAGVCALWLGNYWTIAVFAAWLAVISALALAIMPRKVRLPQQELQAVV